MKRIAVGILCVMLIFTVACGESRPARLAAGSVEFNDKNYPTVCVTPLTENMGINMTTAVLGCDRDTAAAVITVCDTTDECYRRLIDGECDIVIAHSFGKGITEKLGTTALTLTETELCSDALVFMTNVSSGVDTLSAEQITSLYNGEITDWSALGGAELPVTLFGQRTGTAVQNAFEKHISPDITVPPVNKTIVSSSGTFSAEIGYDNRDGALGYTLLSLVAGGNSSVSLVKLDGVAPSKETVSAGEYRFAVPVNAVIRSSEAANSYTRVLYEWMILQQGRLSMGNLY